MTIEGQPVPPEWTRGESYTDGECSLELLCPEDATTIRTLLWSEGTCQLPVCDKHAATIDMMFDVGANLSSFVRVPAGVLERMRAASFERISINEPNNKP